MTIDRLTVPELMASPVWQYTTRSGQDETAIRAVKKLPARDLEGKVVGTQVLLANGSQVWALLGNVHVNDMRRTGHFLTVGIEREGKWFHLARYHDFDAERRGPEALAHFLGLKVDAVFPIAYDVRAYSQGDPTVLAGSIPLEPRERLSKRELFELAVS